MADRDFRFERHYELWKEQNKWTAEKDRLILSLRELNQAHRTLSDARPTQVLEAIREESLAPPGPIGQQIAPLPRQAHPLAGAASVLQLDVDRVRAADSSGAFRRLLEEQWGRRVQAEADEKVRRIFQRVNEDFLQPLERLLREDPEAARLLPAMPSLLAWTRSDMDQWVRQHLGIRAWYETIQYLVVREGQRLQGLALHDAAVSSLWTLVYRGVPGTVATGAVYLGGIALLWWLFEHGSGLTAAWLAGHPSTAWAATKSWLPVVRWLGRVAFAAGFVAVATMLVRDHAAVSRDAAGAGISGPATAGGSDAGEVSPGGRSN